MAMAVLTDLMVMLTAMAVPAVQEMAMPVVPALLAAEAMVEAAQVVRPVVTRQLVTRQLLTRQLATSGQTVIPTSVVGHLRPRGQADRTRRCSVCTARDSTDGDGRGFKLRGPGVASLHGRLACY